MKPPEGASFSEGFDFDGEKVTQECSIQSHQSLYQARLVVKAPESKERFLGRQSGRNQRFLSNQVYDCLVAPERIELEIGVSFDDRTSQTKAYKLVCPYSDADEFYENHRIP